MTTTTAINKSSIVKSLFECFGTGDIPGILDKLSADISWDASRNPFISNPRVFKGKEQVGDFFKAINESMEITVFDPQHFFERGSDLFVNGRFELRLKKDNRQVSVDWTMRYRFDGESIKAFAEYFAPED